MGIYLPIRLLKHIFLTILVISSAYILSEVITVHHAVTHFSGVHGQLHLRKISWINNQTSTTTNATVQISMMDAISLTELNSSRVSRPTEHSSGRNDTSSVTEYRPGTSDCVASSNVAFIKTHKTGSSTLRSLINRHGLRRNLSFVYLKESKNGHIRYSRLTDSLRKQFLPPFRDVRGGGGDVNRGYNMSTVHIRFSRKFFDTFMSTGTKYITIIRDPVEQWLSVVSYFNIKRYLPEDVRKKPFETVATQLALEADTIRIKMISHTNYYFFQNNQVFDLGLSQRNFRDPVAIENYVKYLKKQFELVLVNEYFDESLLLLRRQLCWSWSDILYISRNVQAGSHSVRNETVRGLIRRYNAADQYMYDFFNRTLWEKIREYGEDFERDLSYFRKLLAEVKEDCEVKIVRKRGRVYYQLGGDRASLCHELQANDQIVRIRRRQTRQPAGSSAKAVNMMNSSRINNKGQGRLDEAVKPKTREPSAVRQARISCDKDPMCKKIGYRRESDGHLKIIRYLDSKKHT